LDDVAQQFGFKLVNPGGQLALVTAHEMPGDARGGALLQNLHVSETPMLTRPGALTYKQPNGCWHPGHGHGAADAVTQSGTKLNDIVERRWKIRSAFDHSW
jgi:hypothetical protein